jgi:hypothetical protein
MPLKLLALFFLSSCFQQGLLNNDPLPIDNEDENPPFPPGNTSGAFTEISGANFLETIFSNKEYEGRIRGYRIPQSGSNLTDEVKSYGEYFCFSNEQQGLFEGNFDSYVRCKKPLDSNAGLTTAEQNLLIALGNHGITSTSALPFVLQSVEFFFEGMNVSATNFSVVTITDYYVKTAQIDHVAGGNYLSWKTNSITTKGELGSCNLAHHNAVGFDLTLSNLQNNRFRFLTGLWVLERTNVQAVDGVTADQVCSSSGGGSHYCNYFASKVNVKGSFIFKNIDTDMSAHTISLPYTFGRDQSLVTTDANVASYLLPTAPLPDHPNNNEVIVGLCIKGVRTLHDSAGLRVPPNPAIRALKHELRRIRIQ